MCRVNSSVCLNLLQHKWIHRLFCPVLNGALALPSRETIPTLLMCLRIFRFRTFFFMMAPIQSMTSSKDLLYKKKQHTIKNNSNAACKVVLLTPSFEGRIHDKQIADTTGYTVPSGSTLYQDSGFQGFTRPGVNVIQPKKKPRGGELTPEEKEKNRLISSIRIRVEHVISGVKRYRIELRNWKKGFSDLVMETCCGLHNFRLNFRPW